MLKDLSILLPAKEVLDYLPAGIIIFDFEWKIVYTNKSFNKSLISKEKDSKAGSSILTLLSQIEPELENRLNTLKLGKSFSDILRIGESKKAKLYLLKASPIIELNKFHGGILLFEDILSQKYLNDAILFEDLTFNQIIESVFDQYYFIDSAGSIIHSNTKQRSRNSPDNNSSSIFDIIAAENKNRLKNLISGAIKKKKTISREFETSENKHVSHISVTAIPIFDDKECDKLLILFKDITEEKLSEIFLQKELDTLKQKFQFTEKASDAMIGLSEKGEIVYWSSKAEKLFGLLAVDAHSKFIGEIFESITKRKFNSIIDELDANNFWEGEFQLSSNRLGNSSLYIRMQRLDGISPTIALLCSKLTPNQIKAKEVTFSEKKFKSIVENSEELICTLNQDGQIIYTNEKFRKYFRIDETDYGKKKLTDFMPGKTSNSFNIKKIFDDPADIELNLEDKNNNPVIAKCTFTTFEAAFNSSKYLNVSLTDITEQKTREQKFELLSAVFSDSKEGIAIQAGENFDFVNNSFSELFSIDQNDLRITDPLSLVCRQDKNYIKEILLGFQKGKITERQFEFRGKRKSGDEFFAEAFLTANRIGGNKFVVWEVRDISDQKLEKKLIEESEEKYRSISENIRDVIWSAEKTKEGFEELYYNSAVSSITGYDPSEYIENRHLWHRIIHPDDVQNVISNIKSFYKNREKNSEEFEYRIFHKNGYILWLRNELSVMRKPDGKVVRVFGIVSDITLQRKSEEELQKYAENLKQLNETKDKFISIISHDLRSPFSSIIGFTDLLLSNPDAPADKRIEQINFIKNSSQNLLNLVNSLLDWTRLQTGRLKVQPEKIDSGKVVNDAITLLSGNALKKRIELRSKVKNDLMIHADPNLLLQVFSNLISNAIKFTKEEGIIEINSTLNLEDRYIEFVVRDNGVGISSEDQQKLFRVDTKLTTVGTSGEKGSGLGLSFSNEIVKQHGGEFRIESEEGVGSSFYFTIPLTSSNILLVEDSTTDRILYSKLIKNLLPKFNVIEASNGEEALDIINEISPSVIISDHEMPVIDGLTMVKRIKLTDMKYRPPVIILSSDVDDEISSKYKKFGVEFVFKKPVNLAVFKQAIETELKRPVVN